MDKKEKQGRENESAAKREARLEREKGVNEDLIAQELPAEGKMRKRENTSKINKL